MSYFSDHLAWQQRVAQEFKASTNYLEKAMINGEQAQGIPYPDPYVNTRYSGARKSFNQTQNNYNQIVRSNAQANEPAFANHQNLNHTTVITKRDLLRDRSSTANRKNQNKFGNGRTQSISNPYSYVPKSMKGQQRSYTLTKNAKRQMNQTLDYSNQVPRFNEDIMETVSRKSGPKSIISRMALPQNVKVEGVASRPQTQGGKVPKQVQLNKSIASAQVNKEKILEAVEKMSEKDLEKVSNLLQSHHHQQQEDQNGKDYDQQQDEFEREENGDVLSQQQQQQLEDTISRASKQSKQVSVYGGMSEMSRISNKTYIQHLQKELEEEKEARLKLERELEELRKLSSEISSHLGLHNNKK